MKRGSGDIRPAGSRIWYAGVVVGSLALVLPGLAATGNELTDRTIADAVEDELLYDPAVWPEKFDIAINDGIVTLTGVTDNILEKERAARVARAVKGVRSVVNDLRVRPFILKPAKGLEKAVAEALASDPATDAFEISVAATDTGRVTLTGEADSGRKRSWQGS